MRPRISIRGSVRPSVGRSVRPSVRYPFSKIHQSPIQSLPHHSQSFLDASSHLYKRVCPSVRPSVCHSVHLSVGWSVRPCVRYASSLITSIHLKSPTNHPRPFLDASSHLYKRVCPSVRPSVRVSVTPLLESHLSISNHPPTTPDHF